MTIALPGPGVLVRALTAALRGEPVVLPAVLPPAPSGLGYPAPAAYPTFPMPAGAGSAPAGLSPTGAIELAYLTELADPAAHGRTTGEDPTPIRGPAPPARGSTPSDRRPPRRRLDPEHQSTDPTGVARPGSHG